MLSEPVDFIYLLSQHHIINKQIVYYASVMITSGCKPMHISKIMLQILTFSLFLWSKRLFSIIPNPP